MTKSKRYYSIDALRGFDMLFISGGGAFLHHMYGKTDMKWLNTLAEQMEHAPWQGFTFYDMIFPLFLFISGISLSLSLTKHLSLNTPKKELYKKAFKRMVILIILGMLYKNSRFPVFDPCHIRVSSVLGRIGIATFIVTFIYLNYNIRQRFYWAAGILLTFYAALMLIPVPGYGTGDLSIEGNILGWIDRHIMPGRLINGIFDENALATQLPATVLTIFGTFAGDIIINRNFSDLKKLKLFVASGITGVVIALIWSLSLPIIKHLWTSSFIMLTGGLSFLMLALFYGIIDILNFKRWAFFFKVIGVNSLAIYYMYHFINFRYTADKLFGGMLVPVDTKWHQPLLDIGALLILWSILYFMYRKKIFIKV